MESRVGPLAARVSIFRTRLKSFAREMVVGIQRTARSPLKNQAYDFGVVIMDQHGGLNATKLDSGRSDVRQRVVRAVCAAFSPTHQESARAIETHILAVTD